LTLTIHTSILFWSFIVDNKAIGTAVMPFLWPELPDEAGGGQSQQVRFRFAEVAS
jgi:hypothetical protein